jgi:polar amino acid transport system substrate-binding protein
LIAFVSAIIFALAAGNAPAADVPPDVLHVLIPTGRLRVAINYGNPVVATKGPARELRGVAVDIGRELGRQLDVPVELVGYESVAKVLGALNTGGWDVAFIAVNAARQDQVAFTAPYMQVELTYLVRATPPGLTARFRGLEDLDFAGARIAVAEKSAADLYLTKALKHAALFREHDEPAAFRLLDAAAAEAYASSKQLLESIARSDRKYRVLEGHFATIDHAAAVPVGRKAAADYLGASIEQLKASGFIRAAIERASLRGVIVAPPTRR